jgi:hypothetical protein
VAPPRKRKHLTKIAKASVEKAKHAGRFVYANRKKIINALELWQRSQVSFLKFLKSLVDRVAENDSPCPFPNMMK